MQLAGSESVGHKRARGHADSRHKTSAALLGCIMCVSRRLFAELGQWRPGSGPLGFTDGLGNGAEKYLAAFIDLVRPPAVPVAAPQTFSMTIDGVTRTFSSKPRRPQSDLTEAFQRLMQLLKEADTLITLSLELHIIDDVHCRHGNPLSRGTESGVDVGSGNLFHFSIAMPEERERVFSADGVLLMGPLLKNFFEDRIVELESPICSCSPTAPRMHWGTRRNHILEPVPLLLPLSVVRYSSNGGDASVKYTGDIELPLVLDLSQHVYVAKESVDPSGMRRKLLQRSNRRAKYELAAFAVHLGVDNGGHYVVWQWRTGSDWALCSDDANMPRALARTSADFKRESAKWYMALYRLVSE